MFDHYEIRPAPVHLTQRTEITERRAPTDESIRIIKDIEKEVMSQILGKGRLENNLLDGRWSVRQNLMDLDPTLHLRIKLNGEEFEASAPVAQFGSRSEAVRTAFQSILNHLVGDIFARGLFDQGAIPRIAAALKS